MNYPDFIKEYSACFIKKPSTGIPNRCYLYLTDNYQEVAFVSFSFDENHVWVYEIRVNSDYRRKGIATEIYDSLQKITGKYLKWTPSVWSNLMSAFANSYKKNCEVIHEESNILILKRKFTSKVK